MLINTEIQHFRDYGYTTAPTIFNATEVRAMRAGLERFKRRNVATARRWLPTALDKAIFGISSWHKRHI